MTLADGNIYIVAKGSISEYQHFCHIQKAEKVFDFSVIFIFNRDWVDKTHFWKLDEGEQFAAISTLHTRQPSIKMILTVYLSDKS